MKKVHSGMKRPLSREIPRPSAGSPLSTTTEKGFQRIREISNFWIRKAAEAGDPDAQNTLAIRYDEGDGLPQDPAQAVVWFQKAADNGNPYALFNLAQRYLKGKVVAKSPEQAFALFLKSAQLGLPVAQYQVGTCYANGTGCPARPYHRLYLV